MTIAAWLWMSMLANARAAKMAKRTKYIVHCPDNHIARFSEQWHARIFAVALSERRPGKLIEMSCSTGLIGQYEGGDPTPEFKQHHIDGCFR